MTVYDVSPYLAQQAGRPRTGRTFSTYPASDTYRNRSTNAPGMSMGAAPRFSGGGPAKMVSGVGFRDPYGNGRAAQKGLANTPRVATTDDWESFVEGTTNSMEGYIGLGDNPDFVYEQKVQAERMAGAFAGTDRRDTSSTLYGRPVYRNGMEFSWAADKSADTIREWQAFFAGLGFKTGPAGHWANPEIEAMRAFMGMANQTPGGGMTVERLQQKVMDQVRSGVYFFRGVNEQGDLLPALLGETAAGDLTGDGGGGGLGEEIGGPITETTVRRVTTEFSMDQAMLAVRNQVAQQIGRMPSDDEVRRYMRDLNAAFRADPTVITQVTTTDPVTMESNTEITEDETGVAPEARAIEFSEEVSPEERQEFQAGRYFDAIMAEIGM